MGAKTFGHIGDAPVLEVEIGSKAGARAKILTYGAVLRDLLVPVDGALQRVMLGLNSIEDYVAHSPHFGAVPGRFANRIAHRPLRHSTASPTSSSESRARSTRCTADPTASAIASGSSALTTTSSVSLSLVSADGDMGFPGEMTRDLRLPLLEPATLRVELSAVADRADARQPHPARLFQPRRLGRTFSITSWSSARRLLHAQRRRPDPDRRDSRCRRHAFRFSFGPPGAQRRAA